MRSIRKIVLLAAVVAAAIAVAAPAASGAAKLTYANGSQVATGVKFNLRSTNMKMAGLGNGAMMPCDEVTMPGWVSQNNAESAAGKGLGPGVVNGACWWASQQHAAKAELTGLQFTGKYTGTISLKIAQLWYSGWCESEGTLPMSYTPGTNVINVNATFEKYFPCGNRIEGQFTLATQAVLPNYPSQPIIIH